LIAFSMARAHINSAKIKDCLHLCLTRVAVYTICADSRVIGHGSYARACTSLHGGTQIGSSTHLIKLDHGQGFLLHVIKRFSYLIDIWTSWKASFSIIISDATWLLLLV
jgi:hypothetical protein